MASTDNDNVTAPSSVDATQKQNKRKGLLEDDFFSLSGGLLGSRKKKKTKSKPLPGSSSPISSEFSNPIPIRSEDPTLVKNEDKSEDFITPKSSFTESKESPTKLEGSSTPPVLDKEKMRREIELQINLKKNTKQSSTPLLDESDDSDDESVLLPKRSPSVTLTTTSSNVDENSTSYKFTEENEKKRKYIIRVTTKLPTPQNITAQVDLGCKGLKSFDKILKSSVDFFKKTYETHLPEIYLTRYDHSLSSLVWVEGKILIHSFYTPKTLRIPPPGNQFNSLVDKVESMDPTLISVFLISKMNSGNFMHVFPELKNNNEIENDKQIAAIAETHEKEEEDESSSDEEDLVVEDKTADPTNSETIEVGDGVFSIGLKGKDNKKILCKVTPDTKLRNLLKFYLDKKGLKESEVNLSNAKLIFDDEEMNLDEVVGDTELEDDFEIQVIL
ncbi:ESC2 [Candida jiufengensis]|uniref:ESC2 n=1 Tax=Candida jiufengensis TaxID=497108 RepID=UPI002223F22E|nr:ESC2 [Candida jiufengensis]KAI5951180.1 ESC2 [Candida jiufengensis]